MPRRKRSKSLRRTRSRVHSKKRKKKSRSRSRRKRKNKFTTRKRNETILLNILGKSYLGRKTNRCRFVRQGYWPTGQVGEEKYVFYKKPKVISRKYRPLTTRNKDILVHRKKQLLNLVLRDLERELNSRFDYKREDNLVPEWAQGNDRPRWTKRFGRDPRHSKTALFLNEQIEDYESQIKRLQSPSFSPTPPGWIPSADAPPGSRVSNFARERMRKHRTHTINDVIKKKNITKTIEEFL